MGEPPFDFSENIPFSIAISPGTGQPLAVEPPGLAFAFTAGAAPSSQYLSISNRGSQARTFNVSTSVNNGGSWLAAPASTTAPSFGPGAVQITADPSRLPAGTYTGVVVIAASPGAERFTIPVVMTISGAQQSLALSQSGLTFRAVSGGSAPPSQSFNVLNAGTGTLNWTAAASTLSGGGWLSASPSTGSSSASTTPAVQVQVNPAGLAPGDYYGQVQIAAAGVANSPQVVSVVLTVLPPEANPDPVVQPTGLIFVGSAGGANPTAQNVTLTNLTNRPLTYSTGVSFQQGANWFSVQPKAGTVMPGQPASIAVQPALAGLAVGVYLGELDIRFLESNVTRRVAILLVVIPAASATAAPDNVKLRSAAGCTPTKLLPVFTALGASFTTTAAWPTSLEIRVVDDCGTPMISGSVVATFSSGDPLVAFINLRDGRWTGTWQPRNVSSVPVTITATAQLTAPPLKGVSSIGGNLQPNNSTPSIAAGGVVSAANFAPRAPIAPGSYVAIFGSNLAPGLALAGELPLRPDLNGTQVTLAGRRMPLSSTSNGQINALVPYDVQTNATQQMIVQRGNAYSVPEPVTIATAQPAIFTKDQSGQGAGVIEGIKRDGTRFLVDASHPVSAGDFVVIYCAGLGPVDPVVAAGAAAPSSPLSSTSNPVTVTIGGISATVAFAGLAPGFAGLYQVNAVVPSGITPSPAAPLIITVAEQSSPAVTIAVQ